MCLERPAWESARNSRALEDKPQVVNPRAVEKGFFSKGFWVQGWGFVSFGVQGPQQETKKPPKRTLNLKPGAHSL